ncbi:MAG: hypothetical protein Q8L87_14135 [Anaerolineales bacterium]|jgi:hypothetical protein|nr:hypothetical protein [Anaerolineales bacterium]
MMTQVIDPRLFDQKTRRIKTQVAAVLKKWGLVPRFKRWRLSQDPDTGMVVLFGILNNSYIATHTTIPFNNYFDPRLLHDLANELQVQVVSCNSDGLRYAFILDRGSVGELPTHIDYPFVDNGRLLVRVVYRDNPQPSPTPPVAAAITDDKRFVRQVAGALLKVFDDIKLRDDAALLLSAQNPPDIVIIDEDEFTKRVMEHEVNRQKVKRIKDMLDTSVG